VSYYQQDHLGSIAAITDENGAVIERLAYDPWGKRRYPNGLPDQADSLVGVNTDRGYTMHEHLDEVGVIHMNGRVYDPLIGRFMSADPFIQSPGQLAKLQPLCVCDEQPAGVYGSEWVSEVEGCAQCCEVCGGSRRGLLHWRGSVRISWFQWRYCW
jgi:RHS repeat-associated protein